VDEGLNDRRGKYVARLKGAKRQKNQLELAFGERLTGEARNPAYEGTEAPMAKCSAESLAPDEQWMEKVCQRENLWQAYKRVKGNGGSPGIDGMTVDDFADYLKQHWISIREQLLSGTYQPQPVRRVEIPKPDGGVRKLGIPTVLDRLIQQAAMQVLQRSWNPTFSESSYGFRPGRSAHQAVARAQQHIAAGHRWVVDLDLEKFFDRVNHDKLMSQVAKRIRDKRLLRLIRSWLTAGVLENGLVEPTEEGTPQGGPISPLLSNLVLDQLDRELERRGHRFVRYADDCNIYVRSQRAGQRLMRGLTRLLEGKLKLKVNREKSAVARPWERKFLGFSFTNGTMPKRRIAPKAVLRFQARIRIKELFQIQIDHPAKPRSYMLLGPRDCLMRRASGSEPVARCGEGLVPTALQNLHHCLLDQTVQHRWDTKLAHPSVRLRDFHPTHWLCFVGPTQQLFPDRYPVLLQVVRQAFDRHAVDARTTSVSSHTLERLPEVLSLADSLHPLLIRSPAFCTALRHGCFGPFNGKTLSFTRRPFPEGQLKLVILPLCTLESCHVLAAPNVQAFVQSAGLLCLLLTSVARSSRIAPAPVVDPRHATDLPW
jgi:RNA-directed DNA polymerase